MISEKHLPVPVKVIFGSGSFKKLPAIADSFRPKKILIVTGKTTLKRVRLRLPNSVFFSDVEPNPSLETIEKGLAFCKKEKCDLVIGLGGGSPLDAGKMIAILAKNPGRVSDYFYNRICVSRKGLPFIAVPTTSGTGSEVTRASVITDHKTKIKTGFGHEYMYPKVAIVDPKLTKSMPRDVTIATGFDVLAHGIEAYWSKKSSPESDEYALRAIKLVYENLLKACDHPENLEYRENMSLASLYAGAAIANAGTNAMHSVSYPLTTFYGIPHGLACALTAVEFMKFNSGASKTKLMKIARATGAKTIPEGIKNIQNLIKKTGLAKPLKAYGAKRADIPKVAGMAISPRIMNNPRPVKEKDVKAILERLL